MSLFDGIAKQPIPGDYAPLEIFKTALSRWWLVTLAVLLGAFAGWLVHLFQPPLYEAKASLLVSIDFSNTGLLTQFEEDVMMDAVGALLRAPDVIERVIARAGEEGIPIDAITFKKTGFIERRLGTWELRVRLRSPEPAAKLANIWMDEGYTVLQAAYQHAVSAEVIQQRLDSFENCLTQTSLSETNAILCSQMRLPEIQSEMLTTSAALSAERLASRGIITGALFEEPQFAGVPQRPVVGARGWYILAGSLIGFLAGVVLSPFGFRPQLRKD